VPAAASVRGLFPCSRDADSAQAQTGTCATRAPSDDDRWRVIALHHGSTDSMPGIPGPEGTAGGGPANEGIRLDRLLAKASEKHSGRLS